MGSARPCGRPPPWTWHRPRLEVVEAFEARAASFLAVPYAVATRSGREALALILRALDLAPGDAVAVPAFGFPAVPAAVRDLGLRPVFVDVRPDTFHLDAGALAGLLRRSTVRAVIATHTFGDRAPLEEVRGLCEPRGIPLIEDRAHVFASGPEWALTGVAAFHSLETSKPLAALSGGLAVSREDALGRRTRAIGTSSEAGFRATAEALARQVSQALVTWCPLFGATAWTRISGAISSPRAPRCGCSRWCPKTGRAWPGVCSLQEWTRNGTSSSTVPGGSGPRSPVPLRPTWPPGCCICRSIPPSPRRT